MHNSKHEFSIQFTFLHDLSSFQKYYICISNDHLTPMLPNGYKTNPRCDHNKQNIKHNILQKCKSQMDPKLDPIRGKVDFPMGEAKSKPNITLSGLS